MMCEIFSFIIFVCCSLAVHDAAGSLIAAESDFIFCGFCKGRQESVCSVTVYKQSFCGIAGSHILSLGIDNDRQSFIKVGRFVYVNVTYTVSMAHNRNFGICHDVLNKFIRSSRDDQIY